jgi:hypothetical protein
MWCMIGTPRLPEHGQARGNLDEAERALGRGDGQTFGRAMQELRQLLNRGADGSP